MTRQTDELDRLIDALNHGDEATVNAVTDPEMTALMNAVTRIRRLQATDWPDEEWPSQAVSQLAAGLRSDHRSPSDRASASPDPERDDAVGSTGPSAPASIRSETDPQKRRTIPREFGQIAAAIAVLVLVGGVLAVVFRGMGGGSHGGVGGGASQPVFELNPDLKQAYQRGWGRDVKQVQSAADMTITLNWVGSDSKTIFLVFELAPSPDWPNGKVQAFVNIGATLSDGTALQQEAFDCTDVNSDGDYSCLTTFKRSAALGGEKSVSLDVTIPILASRPGTQTPTSFSVPAGAPASSYHAPTALVVPTFGPYKFTVSVPLYPEMANAPTTRSAVATQATSGPPTPGPLPQTATSSGLRITLLSAKRNGNQVVLTFKIESADPNQPNMWTVGGGEFTGLLVPENDVVSSGLKWDAQSADTSVSPLVPPGYNPPPPAPSPTPQPTPDITGYQVTLPFVLTGSADQPVTVTIQKVRFEHGPSTPPPGKIISGTWTFTFVPANLGEPPLPTPDRFGSYDRLSLAQAQRLVDFPIVTANPIPDVLQPLPDSIFSASAVGSASSAKANYVTFHYPAVNMAEKGRERHRNVGRFGGADRERQHHPLDRWERQDDHVADKPGDAVHADHRRRFGHQVGHA